ncbi:MAG: DUF4149 domain-containing protein [Bacillota bacterium]
MAALRDFVYLVALAWWTGTALYFGGSATPAIFARFPRAQAGQIVETIFPGYYRTAVVSALVLLAVGLWRVAAGRPRAGLALALIVVMLALGLVGAFVLQPRIHALRMQAAQAGPDAPLPPQFGRLHGLSVVASGLSVLAALALWGVAAASGL